MHRWILLVALVVGCIVGCKDKKAEGLPPAQEWSADNSGGVVALGSAGPASPHGANPHGGNPHAGVDMNGGDEDPAAGVGTNPHAGVDMNAGGTDVSKLGLPPPDPNRPIDPSHHVKGVIKIDAKAQAHASPGGAIFVMIKKVGADGQPSGPPLAVEKLTWQKDQLPFELTEAQAMIGGTQLTGDVIVTARYDQDGDAGSKQPGDIVGQAKVTIPADTVVLVLDTLLP